MTMKQRKPGMTSDSPARDFLLPRLTALLDEAVAHGCAHEVAVAVLIDLVTSPRFDTAAPDSADDSDPHLIWERGPDSVVLIGGSNIGGPTRPDAQDEADFLRPHGPLYI
jgi:hypothetical protein